MNPCFRTRPKGYWLASPGSPVLWLVMRFEILLGTMLAVALSPLAPAPPAPPLVFPDGVGVNIHFTRGHARDLDMIAAAGFKFVRMDFGWAGIERQKGEYDWA